LVKEFVLAVEEERVPSLDQMRSGCFDLSNHHPLNQENGMKLESQGNHHQMCDAMFS
jgi:hypothetical protein